MTIQERPLSIPLEALHEAAQTGNIFGPFGTAGAVAEVCELVMQARQVVARLQETAADTEGPYAEGVSDATSRLARVLGV